MAEIKKTKEAINEVFFEEFEKNKKRILLGEEVNCRADPIQPLLTSNFRKLFSERIIDHPPLAEEIFPGIGLGLSIGGFEPVIQFDWGGLLPLFLDQLHRIGNWRYRMSEKTNPSVIVRMTDGGGGLGGPDLSSSYLAHALHVSNLWIAIPSTPYHVKGLWRTAFAEKRPVLFVEAWRDYEVLGQVPDEYYRVPFGSSALFRKGSDVSIITWGYLGRVATRAAKILMRDGVDAEVLVLQTLYPLDGDAMRKTLTKTKKAVIVEEDMLRGGVGAEIAAQIAEMVPGVQIMRVASKNVPRPTRKEYLHYIIPYEGDIVNACKEIVKA